MSVLAKLSLLLIVLLVSLAAYLRLASSGIGCPDWPACYGRIAAPQGAGPSLGIPAMQSGVAHAVASTGGSRPMAWATPAHRLVASALGLCIIGMTIFSFRARRYRVQCVVLLGLTVFLAVLGVWSGGLRSPAIVMGNLVGGFSILALLGWMVLGPGGGKRFVPDAGGRWAILATLLLALQIVLGGLTSANFAATACTTLPDCHGSYFPGPALAAALDLGRRHELTNQGVVVGGQEQADIHKLHRLGAVLTSAVVVIAGIVAIRGRSGRTRVGAAVIVLVLAEVSLGVAATLSKLPIGMAVAHNWLAGLLLLSLLRLMAVGQKSEVR